MNEKPKPVAWMFVNLDGECEQIECGTPPTDDDSITPLYIAPPEDEALRRDAERYRWLRDKAPPDIGDMASVRDSHDPSEIDAAIDAAMEASTAPAAAAADSSTAPEAKP